MTGLSDFFLVLALPCALVGVGLMVAIAGALQSRGYKINWVFLRLFILGYIGKYREVTLRESGRPGPLFYPFVIAMNSAQLFTILGLALRAS